MVPFSSGNVPNGYWNRDNAQANVNRNDPRNSNDNNGSRAAVIIFVVGYGAILAILPASCLSLQVLLAIEKYAFHLRN